MVSAWIASKLKPGDWLCPPCYNHEVMHIQSPAQVQSIIPSDQVHRGAGNLDRPVQPDVISLFAPQSPDDRRCAECGKDKTKVSAWRASKLKPGDWLCQPCYKREVMLIHFHSLDGGVFLFYLCLVWRIDPASLTLLPRRPMDRRARSAGAIKPAAGKHRRVSSQRRAPRCARSVRPLRCAFETGAVAILSANRELHTDAYLARYPQPPYLGAQCSVETCGKTETVSWRTSKVRAGELICLTCYHREKKLMGKKQTKP